MTHDWVFWWYTGLITLGIIVWLVNDWEGNSIILLGLLMVAGPFSGRIFGWW